MKEINAEIYINWDNDGVTVKLSDEEAEKLLALWKEAQPLVAGEGSRPIREDNESLLRRILGKKGLLYKW